MTHTPPAVPAQVCGVQGLDVVETDTAIDASTRFSSAETGVQAIVAGEPGKAGVA
ncbi:hypothetical protein [Streptomyces sp. NPDC054842]